MDNNRRTPVDWDALKQHVAGLGDALAGSEQYTAGEAEAVLSERARQLATVESSSFDDTRFEVICVQLGGEPFGVPSLHVRQVLLEADVTPLPGVPDHVLGVMNLRGEVLPMFDLRLLFSLPADALDGAARYLVLGRDAAELAAPVELVAGVERVSPDELFDPPASAAGVREYVQGVTAQGLLVLNGVRLLEDPRLMVDEDRQ